MTAWLLLRNNPRGALTIAAVFTLTTTIARAQAWTAPAGAGSATIAYQYVDNDGHRLADGSVLRGYDSQSQTLSLEVDYAFTDRLSISAGIPYVFSRYTGPNPSYSGLELDECHCWNDGFQDFNVTARYNMIDGRFALTPYASFGTPSNDYEYFGEAVLGRNLNELRFGLAAGQRLDEISPRFSLQERYSYAVVEQVLGLSLDRSNLSIESSFEVTRRFYASAILAWQYTHGGLRSTEIDTDEEFAQYDRIVKDNNFQAGVGVAYSLPRVDLFLSWVKYVDGEDTHTGQAVTFGASYPFEWSWRHQPTE